MEAAKAILTASKTSLHAWNTAVHEKRFLCFAWTLWTKGSAQPPFLGSTTTKPPRCVRSLFTLAVEGAATTLSPGRAVWMCASKLPKNTQSRPKVVAEDGEEITSLLSSRHRHLMSGIPTMTNSLWTLTMNCLCARSLCRLPLLLQNKYYRHIHKVTLYLYVKLQSYFKCDFILFFKTKFSYCTTVPDHVC